MAKHTLKMLQCSQRKNFKVCLAIFQHYVLKGQTYYIVFFFSFFENNFTADLSSMACSDSDLFKAFQI